MSDVLYRFTLKDSTGPEQVLIGHATSNVMTDYLDRYMPHMVAGDQIIVEAVPLERPLPPQCDGRCDDGRDICLLWHGPR